MCTSVAPIEDKDNEVKDAFYGQLARQFKHFSFRYQSSSLEFQHQSWKGRGY